MHTLALSLCDLFLPRTSFVINRRVWLGFKRSSYDIAARTIVISGMHCDDDNDEDDDDDDNDLCAQLRLAFKSLTDLFDSYFYWCKFDCGDYLFEIGFHSLQCSMCQMRLKNSDICVLNITLCELLKGLKINVFLTLWIDNNLRLLLLSFV